MSENTNLLGSHQISNIEVDMQDAYLRYSMSVIVARALPDVRDGFKPVHRRVMFGMHKVGAHYSAKTMKSARIVGEVMGKYHPHGDAAIYDTLVRMTQDFSLRYPIVHGQGNFGSIDGDSAAAMRYTEAKLAKMGELMLEDLDKDTVDMVPNYDAFLEEPDVLPSAFPNLLVNGSTGIAVGMATSMAPHNLKEICAAIHAVCENPDIAPEELLAYVSGPDFPTGAIICGRSGIRDAYLTGYGKVRVRARTRVEEEKGRSRIIVEEIPYMVNKALLVKKIAELVRDKKVEGISDLRDESKKDIRVVIELKKDAVPEVVLNNLYKYTQLQDTFSINNLVLVNKQPKVLPLKDLISHYIEHRIDVIVRKSRFELKKSKDRQHILEGLLIAQNNIDEVVAIIKAASSRDTAKQALMDRFQLDDVQAQAIVNMTLGSLTGLEREKLQNEFNELQAYIADLEDVLAKRERQIQILLQRLDEVNQKYGDERRTTIEDSYDEFDYEDLLAEEEQVITLSKEGYIKRLPIDTFKAQNRGGKGIIGAGLKEEDNVEQIFTASTHSYLLIFTNKGRVHWTKVYRLPEGARNGKGRPIINFVELVEGEKVSAIVPVRKFGGYFCLVFATKKGVINKMDLKLFSKPRKAGVNAITLNEDDELVKVQLVGLTAEEFEAQKDSMEFEDIPEDVSEEEDNASEEITKEHHPIAKDLLMLATKNGQSIVFPISACRTMGRGTRGVRGITLSKDDEVISLLWLKPNNKVLTISENGYAKRTEPDEYRITRRGGKGVKNLNITEKTGEAVFVESVADDYDLIITSRDGQVIRIKADSIRVTGRVSQGVKAITLREGDLVQDATALPSVEDLEQDSAESQESFKNVEDTLVEESSEMENDSVDSSEE